MRTVTLPIEEYEALLQDQQDKKRLMEELAADAKDRGFFVQQMTHIWENKTGYGWFEKYNFLPEKNSLKIITKDKVLTDAQTEINRLATLADELNEKNVRLANEIEALKGRGFLARLLNKNDGNSI